MENIEISYGIIKTCFLSVCIFIAEGGGGGVLPYKSDAGARRKISTTPLKGTRIFFYGRVPNSFPHLKGTNSTTTN